MKLTSYRIKAEKKKQIKIISKLDFQKYLMYNYAHHNKSTTGTLLLIRILFKSKEEEKIFDNTLKKLNLKYKKGQEELNDELIACCKGTEIADFLIRNDLIRFRDVILHTIYNSLGFNYLEEVRDYTMKSALILNGLLKKR